jgi:hypothetical protein
LRVRIGWLMAITVLGTIGCSAKGSQPLVDAASGGPLDSSSASDVPPNLSPDSSGSDGTAGLDSGSRDGGPDQNPTGSCTGGGQGTSGWVDIQAEAQGLGTGLITSPIVRCERGAGRLAVWASGTERDGVDQALVRIEIPSGFSGPGSYTGRNVVVEVFHDDIGGFSAGSGSSCEVCINGDGSAGSLHCTGLVGWFGSQTMNVPSGVFVCPAGAPPQPTAMGGGCSPTGCEGQGVTGYCAVPQPSCAGNVCVGQSSSSFVSGVCTARCETSACPAGWRCETVKGSPARVCVSAAVCGNGMVEMGEACDAPPPTDHCAAGCAACRVSARPGWVQMDARAGTQHMQIDALPGGRDVSCFRSLSANPDGTFTVNLPSCDPGQDFDVHGQLPLKVGSSNFTPMAHLCVSRPAVNNSAVDRLVYCAGSDATPAPGEVGQAVIAELRCGGKGLRGSFTAHMVYKQTVKAQTDDPVSDPAHAGEALDVSGTFDLVEGDSP